MLKSTLVVGSCAMLLLAANKASADSAQPVMIMNEEPEPVQPPGIDYLGAGYDLVFGNPDGAEDASSVTDPGFRVHIVKYNWNETLNTCSGLSDEWTCPREVSILPQTSCLQQSSSTMISSTKSFQRALQKDCSVKASVKGSYGGFSASASFSASSAMATMQKKIQKEKVYTFQSKAVCVDYTATLKTGIDSNTLDPLPDFVTAVNEMPLTYRSCFIPNNQSDVPCPKRVTNGFGDLPPLKTTRRLEDTDDDSSSDVDDSVNDCGCDASVIKYFRLIQLYGTHYTTRVEMGGKIIHRVEMRQSDVSVLQKKGVDVAYGASVKASYSSGMGSVSASVSAKRSTSEASESYNAVMNVAKKEININIGGSPNEDWRQWAASTTNTPMPIRYQLSPLVDMINKVDPRKGPLFEQAVSDYISAYSQVLSFDTGKELKVVALEIQYSLLVGTMKSATFRVMIGNKGDMIPAVTTVTNVTGSFQVPVPAKLITDFDAFQGNVPITLEYLSGVFTPPKAAMMEAHEAVATGHNNWVHMEAELAMKKKKKKAPAVASTATSVYFNTIQPFAVMDDKSEIPLDDQYAGKILNVGDVWSINPMD